MNTKEAKLWLTLHLVAWPVVIAASWFEPRIGLAFVIGIFGWSVTKVHMVRLQLLQHKKGEWLESQEACKCSHRRWQHEGEGECSHPQCSCTAYVPGEVA